MDDIMYLGVDCEDIMFLGEDKKGYEAGRINQHNNFWNAFQSNGNRTHYEYAFYGNSWKNENFAPLYDIAPLSTNHMLSYNLIAGDFVELLIQKGITIDFSKAKNMNFTFYAAKVSRIGVVDTYSLAEACNCLFCNCPNLETIDNLIIYSDNEKFIFWDNCFIGAAALKNITITGDGRITQNNANFADCKLLSKDSITNIINYLSDDVSGKSVKFSYDAVVNAFGSVDNEAFLSLISSKSNWSIVLI